MSTTSFVQDLYDLFERTVTIEPFVSQTATGKPTYGTGVSYPARIILKDVGIRMLDGTVIIGKGRVYLPGVYTVTTRDRVTLPAGILSPSQPPILSVSVSDDETAGCFTTLVIG